MVPAAAVAAGRGQPGPDPRRASARTTLELIWPATGRPERGSLNTWRPYEHLDWDTQEAMLHAVATTLQQAAGGQIISRGALGSALRPAPHLHVYDGDRPSPQMNAWQEAMAEVEEAIVLARTDRDAARQLRGGQSAGRCSRASSRPPPRRHLHVYQHAA